MPALLDAAGVGAGTRVLDVGCGTGRATAAAAARGAQATGIDLADGMLARARERHPGLTFIRGDAEDLPFGDAQFDALLAGFVLNHLPDADRGLREFARVLAPPAGWRTRCGSRPSATRCSGSSPPLSRTRGVQARGALPPGPDPYRFARAGRPSRRWATPA